MEVADVFDGRPGPELNGAGDPSSSLELDLGCPSVELKPSKPDRYVPRAVKRAVAARDEGRCTFVGVDGKVCGSTYQLEYEHRDPVALGGQATTDRMTIYCRVHNQHEARKLFGTLVGPRSR